MRTIALTLAVLLAGCSSTPARYSLDQAERALQRLPAQEVLVDWPAVGSTATATVGAQMVRVSRAAVVPVLALQEETVLTTPYSRSERMRLRVPRGELRLVGRDQDGGMFYEAAQALPLSYESEGFADEDTETAFGGIYLPAAGAPAVYWTDAGARDQARIAPARVAAFTQARREIGQDGTGVRRELVYAGISQTTVSLLYREYWGNAVVPAFAQELRYDTQLGKVVGYKGARLEILEASNTEITYRVLVPLSQSE